MTKKQSNTTFLKDLHGGDKAKRGESGQTELLFILLTFCLLSLSVLFGQRMILHYKMGQQRERAYLCLKQGFETHIDTKEKFQYTNYAISAALVVLAASMGSAAAEVKQSISALKKLQSLLLYKSFYQIYTNKNCSREQKLVLISHTPIAMNWKSLKIKRTLKTLASFKSKKRYFIYPSNTIRQSNFFIKGEVHFKPKIQLRDTHEYDLTVLSPINRAAIKASIHTTFLDFKNIFTHPKNLIFNLLDISS